KSCLSREDRSRDGPRTCRQSETIQPGAGEESEGREAQAHPRQTSSRRKPVVFEATDQVKVAVALAPAGTPAPGPAPLGPPRLTITTACVLVPPGHRGSVMSCTVTVA